MQTHRLSGRLAQVTGTCEGAFPPSHSFDLGLERRCVCCEKTQADTWARDFLSLVTSCVGSEWAWLVWVGRACLPSLHVPVLLLALAHSTAGLTVPLCYKLISKCWES